jgi:hypothetical protein
MPDMNPTGNWTTNLKFVKDRPQARTPNEFREALRATLEGGSLQVNQGDIPIKLKSLRTTVAGIAKDLKVRSHVLLNKQNGMISMWLERPAAGQRQRTKKTGTNG